jgi:hypothetical protein
MYLIMGVLESLDIALRVLHDAFAFTGSVLDKIVQPSANGDLACVVVPDGCGLGNAALLQLAR